MVVVITPINAPMNITSKTFSKLGALAITDTFLIKLMHMKN